MSTGIITFLLIAINVWVSYKGFSSESFIDKYRFEVDKILVEKDYKRLITSGFLHVSWMHLLFNMFSLYIFSGVVEMALGEAQFLLVYFISLVGGNLLSLFIHRNHPDYSAVGASGAISGIMFATIALFPGMSIGFFLLPISFPAWLYGVLYIGFSIYGIHSKRDNVGHEAHLGGALIGMLAALILQPSAFKENYFAILIIAVPAIVFIYFIITRPQTLLIDNLFYKKHKNHYSPDHLYNEKRHQQQEELDAILDKISRKGMNSLSKVEKEKLKLYSQTIR